MSEVFFIKQGATGPSLLRQLRDETGAPLRISTSTVSFSMAERGKAAVISERPCVLVDPDQAVVRLDWEPSDTEKTGRFICEFRIQYPDGTSEIVPNPDYLEVRIAPRVGSVS